jgi:MYST family zinc finger domain
MPSLEANLPARRASLTTGHFPASHGLDSHNSLSEQIDREKALERNIDNVVFGDVIFKSWYPSWYPKEIIGEKALSGDGKGIVVQTLYVCKRCFSYSKVPEEWVRHSRLCEKEVPGRRVYVHDARQGVWSVWEVDGGVDTVSLHFSFYLYHYQYLKPY